MNPKIYALIDTALDSTKVLSDEVEEIALQLTQAEASHEAPDLSFELDSIGTIIDALAFVQVKLQTLAEREEAPEPEPDYKELCKELFVKTQRIYGILYAPHDLSKQGQLDRIREFAAEAYNLHSEAVKKGLYR